MKKFRISPQERKVRDYTNQRKNAYGENDKSSRNSVRKKKLWGNRVFRRAVNNILATNESDYEQIQVRVSNTKRHNWKKYPDDLIIETLDYKWSGSSRNTDKPHISRHRNEAIKRLKKAKKYTNL